MHRLDAYAHASRLRHVHPLNKFAFALTVIALCLVLDRPAVSAAALLWMAGLSLLWGGATPGFVLRLLAAEGLFLALGVVAVAVQIGPVGQGGGWSATVTPASLAQAGALLLRAFACASAMNFLALTTPILELAAAAQRFRAPAALLDVTLMMYRSVFLLLETLMRMQDEFEQQLNTRRDEMINQMLQDIRKAVAAIAQEKGLAVVFDSTQVLYASNDITSDVIKRLNKK